MAVTANRPTMAQCQYILAKYVGGKGQTWVHRTTKSQQGRTLWNGKKYLDFTTLAIVTPYTKSARRIRTVGTMTTSSLNLSFLIGIRWRFSHLWWRERRLFAVDDYDDTSEKTAEDIPHSLKLNSRFAVSLPLFDLIWNSLKVGKDQMTMLAGWFVERRERGRKFQGRRALIKYLSPSG